LNPTSEFDIFDAGLGRAVMEFASDNNLLARILLSLATAGYAFATIRADFNKPHATNPKWTRHARFHVV
jgi:hypothetical protein